ncbi:STAS/SEC14 domain-containing protein [Roseovarius spongiae]|uniref:STAS/SEC14 domain-containing protein n=1 Tax=Roseovarius spongiae TaxID=2320272 RepID=A0A3A8ARI1_9RHOB|nr:STAS/SEC14 domain-containing protein [Roseovarius spongiae]RKF12505.1 STAS/SEC14 domain-containing protein [Roseovarius spongiae]
MFTETQTTHDDVIGLACEGKLSESDLKRMHALLHERLQGASKPGLVLDLTRFEGYEGPSALLEDLKIDTAHTNGFHRVAVVGEGALMDWGTKLANFLTKAELGQFDPEEMEAAVAWVREM